MEGDTVYRYDITGSGGTMSVIRSTESGKTNGIVFAQVFRDSSPAPAPTFTP